MTHLPLIAPVLILSVFGFLALGLDALLREAGPRSDSIGFWLSLIGLSLAAWRIPLPSPVTPNLFGHQMLVWDGLAYFLTWLAIVTLIMTVLVSARYRDFAG